MHLPYCRSDAVRGGVLFILLYQQAAIAINVFQSALPAQAMRYDPDSVAVAEGPEPAVQFFVPLGPLTEQFGFFPPCSERRRQQKTGESR